ncbi:MAG TPA: OmpA family protein [Puia sp.]|nr:OmpA family protein [Puia sp.]
MRPICFYSVIFLSTILFFPSCVSTGKFNALQLQKQQSDSLYASATHSLTTCQNDNNTLKTQKKQLQDQADDLNLQLNATKDNNTQLRAQLQNLTNLSSSQAESIRKSLDNIGAKDDYLMGLRSAVSHRDSVNLAVLLDLKATIGGYADQGVTLKTEKSVVSVDLPDQLLFTSDSNSYTLTEKGKSVLSKVAEVLKDQPEVDFIVEGHTDSISHPREILVDSWDLSVKRATSIVRALQNDYKVSPIRMTASGRGEYLTVAANDTPEGRAANRRTRITFLPKLDQLFQLLDHGKSQSAN